MSGEFWTYMDAYSGQSGPPPPSVQRLQVRAVPAARGRGKYTRQEARLAGACCVAVILFAVVCCCWPHHPAPLPPAWDGGNGPVQMYPHSPGLGAAVIGAEVRGVGHAAGFAGRMAFRGGVLRGLRGGGFRGGFRGGSYTPGGFSFHGFSFGGF